MGSTCLCVSKVLSSIVGKVDIRFRDLCKVCDKDYSR